MGEADEMKHEADSRAVMKCWTRGDRALMKHEWMQRLNWTVIRWCRLLGWVVMSTLSVCLLVTLEFMLNSFMNSEPSFEYAVDDLFRIWGNY